MFRLFVTNPDLLKNLRPKTYVTTREYLIPAEERCWQDVLREYGAPAAVFKRAYNKIEKDNP